MMDKVVTSEFVIIGGVNTHVLKCGNVTESKHLILIIPGNPGIIEFYEDFMTTLYKSSDCKIPVLGISHAGHVKAPPVDEQDSSHHENMYNLSGQIQHKLLFIENYVPPGTKLVLIGHSIGCYMILHMMKKLPENRVTKACMLFPTIERMAVSPQGKIMTPVLKYFRHFAAVIVYCLSWMPKFLKKAIVSTRLGGHHIPQCARRAALNLFDAESTYNCMYLANIEMASVKTIDIDLVKQFSAKLIFYFGQNDHWCPVEYYYDLKKTAPYIDVRLCTKGMDHAFILSSSHDMAELVWNWIESLVCKDCI